MSDKYDEILENQNKILKKLNVVVKDEEIELDEDEELDLDEKKEEDGLEKLESLEENLKDQLKEKPIKKITSRDFYRSIVGAFFGVLGHFAFFYGIEISENISMFRASMLYIVAFIIGAIFLYMTGYRKIQKNRTLKYIPLRLLIIYLTSVAVVIFVLFLFGFISTHTTFEELFKTVATVSILAVIGSVTADLIGKNE